MLLASAAPARAAVEVHVGFMDEEVNDLTTELIKQHPDRQVLVVERSVDRARATGRLFDRPLSSYSGTLPVIMDTANIGNEHSTAADLARALKKTMDTAKFRGQLEGLRAEGPAPKMMTEAGFATGMSVLAFNPGADATDPIVLVRSPEMGLQPDLVAAALARTLDAIAQLPEADVRKGGVRFSTFGTAGGINTKSHAGDVSRVAGSVFVGARRGPGNRYYAMIALGREDRVRPKIFLREEFPSRAEAEAHAKRMFAGGMDPRAKKALRQEIRELSQKGAVSLTVSFFAAQDMKDAGRRFGLDNVNMEDFHVLKARAVLERAKGLATEFTTSRLIADPPHIPHDVAHSVNRWAKKATLSLEAYVDAIVWGLKGLPMHEVPATAHWSAFAKKPRARSLVFPLDKEQPDAVLSPFFVEIATDFLKDASRGHLLLSQANGVTKHSIVEPSVLDQLPLAERGTLEQMLHEKNEQVRAKASALLALADTPQVQDKALRDAARHLVEEAAHLEIPPALESALQKAGGPLAVDGKMQLLGRADGQLEVWVRPGKWAAGANSRILSALARPKEHNQTLAKNPRARPLDLESSVVDRAFYKSAFMPALHQRSAEHVTARKNAVRLPPVALPRDAR
jgi:hypothetical protein